MSPTTTTPPSWFRAEDCRLDDLRAVVEVETDPAAHPRARSIERGVPIYATADLVAAAEDGAERRELLGELGTALMDGAGIVVVTDAVPVEVVDAVTEAFVAMVEEERDSERGSGDHFAKPGANDRVWNVMEKLALREPDLFAAYYASPAIHLVSEAWLGPGFQITSQVNIVNPGGEAQAPHRDYHLGFLSDADAERYPPHVHRLSPALTLQAAVAHSDMPVETGPTTYLPHSQKYGPGYVAWRRPEFATYYAERHVQLPLAVGDSVYFNPAVLHAAGTNRTADRRRVANLLQVSSPFGRAMEAMDRMAMVRAVLPALRRRIEAGASTAEVERVVVSMSEGYAFPSNLDLDHRIGELAPPSQAALILDALAEGWSDDDLLARLADKATAQRMLP
ncbi:MAG: phytanoyl-CoA dioxygenase family protein [Actinomycetota bacterium]